MCDSELIAFLEDLRAGLRCDAARRDRIVDEARAHIQDGCARGLARGLSREDALLHALAAFGSAQEVAQRFAKELRPPLFSKRRSRHLCLALAAQAGALAAIPVLLRVASQPVAKCLISAMFASIGAFMVADIVQLGRPALRRPLSWALFPYLAMTVPFALANYLHRNAEMMKFDVLGIPAAAIHSAMVALFVVLAMTTVFEIIQTRRLARG
jgi:hypothetical protein